MNSARAARRRAISSCRCVHLGTRELLHALEALEIGVAQVVDNHLYGVTSVSDALRRRPHARAAACVARALGTRAHHAVTGLQQLEDGVRSDVADTAGDHHRLPTPPARRRARQQRERQRGEPAHERMFVGVGGDLASAAPGTRGAMFAAARAI